MLATVRRAASKRVSPDMPKVQKTDTRELVSKLAVKRAKQKSKMACVEYEFNEKEEEKQLMPKMEWWKDYVKAGEGNKEKN